MPITETTNTIESTQNQPLVDTNTDGSVSIPDVKVIIQKFAKVFGESQYSKIKNKIIGNKRKLVVDNGGGVDTISNNPAGMDDYNKNDLDGGIRPALEFQRAINTSQVDTNYLPKAGRDRTDGIKQIRVSEQDILGVQNFLSGKSQEYDKLISQLTAIIERYEFHLVNKELERLYNAIKTANKTGDPVANDVPTGNFIKPNGNTGSTDVIDALTNYEYSKYQTLLDNEVFAIGSQIYKDENGKTPNTSGRPLPTGFQTNCNVASDWGELTHPRTTYTIQNILHNFTIRDRDKFENQVESFTQYPSTYRNPCRDVIQAKINGGTYYIQFTKAPDEQQTDSNGVVGTFTQLSSIAPITPMTTPTLTTIAFTNAVYDQFGGQIQATIGGTLYQGSYVFVNSSSYNCNFIQADEIYGIYQNGDTDGIYSMYNLEIENMQEGLKALIRNKYFNLRMNVVTSNMTRAYIYKDPGLTKLQVIGE